MATPSEPDHASIPTQAIIASQTPLRSPLPTSESLNGTNPGEEDETPGMFLTVPPDIRQLIYNAIIPEGPLIILRLHAHTTLLKHLYPLSQTCSSLHTEIANYLTTRPLAILCAQGNTPGILNGIPPHVLARVETLIVEDQLVEPNWALLRGVRTLCITSTYEHRIPANPPNTQPPIPTHELHTTIRLTHPAQSDHLPTNNTALGHAHRWWQALRLTHPWLRKLWRRDERPYDTFPRIRILLRRVFEATVDNDPTPASVNDGVEVGRETVVVSWHGVVDVDSRSVLENRYLATRRRKKKGKTTADTGTGTAVREEEGDAEGAEVEMVEDAAADDDDDDDAIFPYAAQNWWRKEVVVKKRA